jgi:Transcriptional regulator/sugar kinase
MTLTNIGIELGRKSIRCVIIDDTQKILSRSEIPSPSDQGSDAVIVRMAKLINDMITELGMQASDIHSIGAGVPGPLNNKAGMVYGPPNMKGWDRVPLGPRLTVLTGIPVHVENDAKALGWAEYLFGAGKGCRNMVSINLGTGVGGAVIIDGELFIGKDGMAGEIGHIPIERDGRLCPCGNRGCAEAYISPSAIVSRFRSKVAEGWTTNLLGRGEAITSSDIFAAAEEGDPLSKYIVMRTGKSLGALAAIIMNFINPDRIIVAGSLLQYGSALLDAMRNECRARCFGPNISVDILPASLGSNAGVIGVANLAIMRTEQRVNGQKEPNNVG